MNLRIKFLALSMLIFLCGCDTGQYQIVTGSDGALYRFNKKTGELSMVMEDKKIVRLAESQKPSLAHARPAASLDKPIDRKESKYPGKDLRVKLETIWRENKLCYKFSAYPYKSLEKIFLKKKQDYIYSLMKPGFTVELIDKNGFLVKEIKINLWNMTKVSGSDGKPDELVINSQLDCTRPSYESIDGYTVKWMLDSDMLDDDPAK